MTTKKKTRRAIHQTLNAMEDRAIFEKSVIACQRLCRLREFEEAKVVMMFFSVHREIDTSLALIETLRRGKTLVLPRVNWETRSMDTVIVRTLNCEINVGPKMLREPVGGDLAPLADIDLVVAPGLGFDQLGNRIGRGAAFYDRFFANPEFRGTRCGFTFEEQIIPSVPTAEHDIPMNLVVSDARVMRFQV